MDTEFIISKQHLDNIVDAVRSKTGENQALTLAELTTAIDSLDSIWTGTQEDYDELSSHDTLTFYFIEEEEQQE